ncbi:diguanylate cyclase domain-containing protein [Pantoea sp. B65]|uniref:sensor domain-containing protein n=1 Tax=Pantoea sp. B65 TaxID=2813359 RepID=UPI0039B4798E
MLNEIMISGRKLDLTDIHSVEGNVFMSLILDLHGGIRYANPLYCQCSGYSCEELIGEPFRLYDDIVLLQKWRDEKITNPEGNQRLELRQRKKNGDIFWLDITLVPLRDKQDEIVGFSMICFDVTRQVLIRERLHFRAHNDALTKTLNRQGYYIHSRKIINVAKGLQSLVAVAILDLDGFKKINDELGHAAGDEVLRDFTLRVKSCLPDDAVFGRLGGDEFALTFIEKQQGAESEALFSRIVDQVNKPILIRNIEKTIFPSVSIGYAHYPRDGTHFSSVMRAADMALYRVKSLGGNNSFYYKNSLR